VIEPATTAHAAALAAIHAAAFPPGEAWEAEALALQLGVPGSYGLIAAAGGMVLARVAADEAEILTLAVAVPACRRGLGRALLRAAQLEAAKRRARSMFLEVAERNAAARALYAGEGFVAVGRRRGYYAAAGDALILCAPLSPAPDPCG
jgi:ribosomal-protein-alanine N-acetyltransferase